MRDAFHNAIMQEDGWRPKAEFVEKYPHLVVGLDFPRIIIEDSDS
jgi:hypothetical protein